MAEEDDRRSLLLPRSVKGWHLGLLFFLALIPGQLAVPAGGKSHKNYQLVTAIPASLYKPVNCSADHHCPENAGCFADEVYLYAPANALGLSAFCHCFLGFYWDSSTNACVDMREGGNCDEKTGSKICFRDEHVEFCPYCSVKYNGIALGNFASGEGDYYDDDPQIMENGDSGDGCGSARSTKASWMCWYEDFPDKLVPFDSITMELHEDPKCEYHLLVFTPLACCWAQPNSTMYAHCEGGETNRAL